MDTTLSVYKKQITPQGLLAGMELFQKSLQQVEWGCCKGRELGFSKQIGKQWQQNSPNNRN